MGRTGAPVGAELEFAHRPRPEHANGPAPRTHLDLLRFLERSQEWDLARTRRWIADEERRQAEHALGVANRPPEPDWLIERGSGDRSCAECRPDSVLGIL
ncbi:hypothetical protein [Streptomyces longispororuber]|uniref:hypothetical protein n=1 Tax=Streptomyces longispororuber TaxID=68230 RepID=UPI0021094DF6|nr:hypothetical protein [Streptomyces longispororuber]MCQ4206435.1 hypothetical protein [Streptomyces longispororuber]